jgi:predicted ATPase with chaperone activity
VHRIFRVARTIADLSLREQIQREDVQIAIDLRALDEEIT